MPQIEVTFDIDANGIVNVSAKDKATNKEQSIRIQANGGLSDADIEKMVKEAEANATADKARKELVEAQNAADSLIHSTEKALAEHGDKVGADEKAAIETGLTELKAARDGTDPEDIRAKTNTLVQASMKLGEAMYAQASGGSNDAPADDGVVDAEFEEVSDDDQKKSA
jgi:molecular chaperone DnaK